MSDPAIWLALFSALMGMFVAACTVAARSFSRGRLGDLLEARDKYDRLQPFIERVPELLLTLGTLRTVCNLVVLLAMVYWAQAQFAGVDDWVAYLVAFVAAGGLITVFGVAIPTSMARYQGEAILAGSMPLLMLLVSTARPITFLLRVFDPIVRRIVGQQEARENGENPLTEEILSVVEDHHEVEVDEHQKDMLEAVIELPLTTAGEIMTPRTDVTGIEAHADLESVKQTILAEGHSRIPVYDEKIDNILGMLYAKDLITFLGDGNRFDLQQILRPALMVPENKSVRDLLMEFRSKKVHLAIVLDEYGGTAGLITIEDILEEIVGEIEDEYEPEEERPSIRIMDSRVAEVDARVEVEDVNDRLDLSLPEDEDYTTLGGFVFSHLGHIPDVGESFAYDGDVFEVIEAERTRVAKVKITLETPLPTEALDPSHNPPISTRAKAG